jgi:hypothetical protein
MYGYLKEPYKTNKKDTVYKVMIHETKKDGTYAYLYTSRDAVSGSFDYHYPDLENALEDWEDEIDEQGWIQIGDPMPDCQHDCFLPIRIKGRNTGNPQWGQYEILKDGKWEKYHFE